MTGVHLYVYETTHIHSRAVCGPFAEGARAPLVAAHRLQEEGAVAVYGRLRGCNEILQEAIRRERTWYYIDRGYFGATRDTDYSGFFRVTRNALQHTGVGRPDFERLSRFELRWKPSREGGSHVLICPPTRVFASLSGFDADAWTSAMIAALQKVTDRPLRVREKPAQAKSQRNPPLEDDLRDCWAMVTHSSNAAVEAVVSGVPVFCTGPCPALTMGSPDITALETPRLPSLDERQHWAAVLAANQWTLDEMRSGKCWRDLNS